MAMRECYHAQIENEMLDAKDEALKECRDKIEKLESRIEAIEKYFKPEADISSVNSGNVKSDAKSDAKNLEDVIKNILMDLGIQQHLKGYKYIIEAIKLMYENEAAILGITKIIYPGVAKKCDSTWLRVERSIRHAIENGMKGNETAYRNIFGNTINSRKSITNGQFLATVCNLVKRNMG